ncbi:histidine phosphatase family protein [Phenylobacterium sp.]|uniref:histidine phosphatase family protein n=1 Tax=Phenylobacterium sp. TaxID=1871053 RepID=UPI00356377A3
MSAAALILVRHAAPVIEPDAPPPTWRLSAAGREAALALAGRLAAFAPAAVAASPEPKALETAEIIAAQLGLAVSQDPGFAEHRRPDLKFGSRDDFESAMAAFFADPAQPFLGGESGDEAHDRFAAALARHAARPLLVATHGTVLSLYLSRRLNLDPFDLWKSLALPEAFVLDADGWLLARVTAA